MLDKEIKSQIIQPALQAIELDSPNAVNLVYATGLVETNYEYLKQMSGPALGFWQCEPDTYKSIRVYLENRINKDLIDKVLAATGRAQLPQDASVLIYDLRYAAIICRILYHRVHEPLPMEAEALTNYYLKYYNTKFGKATYEKCIFSFQKACLE
jgi:hypothetical protein